MSALIPLGCTVWLSCMALARKLVIPPGASPLPDWSYSTVWTMYTLWLYAFLSTIEAAFGPLPKLFQLLISFAPTATALSVLITSLYVALVFHEDKTLSIKYRRVCPRYLYWQMAIHCFAPVGVALHARLPLDALAADGGRCSFGYTFAFVTMQYAAFIALKKSHGVWPYDFMLSFSVWHHVAFFAFVFSTAFSIALVLSSLAV
jgi:hypothetical protein